MAESAASTLYAQFISMPPEYTSLRVHSDIFEEAFDTCPLSTRPPNCDRVCRTSSTVSRVKKTRPRRTLVFRLPERHRGSAGQDNRLLAKG